MTDFLDLQSDIRERVRRIEIGPGPPLVRVPTAWMPYYGAIDETSLIAQALLPMCPFRPDAIGPLHPAAQQLATDLWTEGFSDTFYVHREQGRALMLMLIQADAWVWPAYLRTTSQFQHRVEGDSDIHTGEGWQQFNNARFVKWGFYDPTAQPPDDTRAWRFSPPPDGQPDAGGADVYWAEVEGGYRYQAIGGSPAGSPEPGRESGDRYWSADPRYRCDYNSFPFYNEQGVGWHLPDRPEAGLVDRSISSAAMPGLFCFAYPPPNGNGPNPTGLAIGGTTALKAHAMDPLLGPIFDGPPSFYTGQIPIEVDKGALGDLLTYPGWTEWRSRVAAVLASGGFDAMLGWYRQHYRRLSPPGPSYRWQRAALWLPWQGQVEFRIWQRVVYLRGSAWNLYEWHRDPVVALPPGVQPITFAPRLLGRARATGGERPWPCIVGDTLIPPFQGATSGYIDGPTAVHVENPVAVPGTPASPHTIVFNNLAVAVAQNASPGPDGEPIVP